MEIGEGEEDAANAGSLQRMLAVCLRYIRGWLYEHLTRMNSVIRVAPERSELSDLIAEIPV